MKSLRKKNIQTIDHEEVYEKIKQNTTHMDDIQKCIEKQLQTFISINQSTTMISESMKKYSIESANFNSKIPLADCLQRSSEWQNSIGDIFKHLGNLLYDRTTQPLKETIRIQSEIVKDSKKKLKGFASGGNTPNNVSGSPTSSSPGISMSNNMGTQKIEKKDQIEYDKLSKDTLQLYRDSELALENSAIQSVLSQFESYYDFFQKGAFQMNKIKLEIENYKKIILETNKAAAKLRNYIPRKTFGIRLEEVFARESNKSLPSFLEELFKYLERVAPQTEGIFRISAGKSSVESLQKRIEDNQPLELNQLLDSHVVSSVLKLFFRMLPEPLIHHAIYKGYLHLGGQNKPSQQVTITELKRLISSLKVCNQVVLKHILQICSLVAANKETTKMDLNNLAVVIGPNLLEPLPNLKAEDLHKPETFTEFYGIFSLLVENCQAIFPQVSQTEFGRSRSQTEPVISPITKSPSTSSSNIASPLVQSPITSTNKTNLSSSDFIIIENPNTNSSNTPSSSTSSSPNLSSSQNNLSFSSLPSNSPIPAHKTTPPLTTTTTAKKKITEDNLLKPIDIQITFIHITSNLGKVKSHLDQITTVPEGIQLIKIFKRLGDEYIAPIQKLIQYKNTKPKPNYDNEPTEDKIIKIQRTLSYTYDIIIDTLINSNNLFESSLSDQDSESLTTIFNNLNEFTQNEVKNLFNENEQQLNEIQTSTASLSSF